MIYLLGLLVLVGIALFAYVLVTVGYGALYAEARAALERGEVDEAIRRLERLVRRYPDHAQAHHLLALAWRRRGENERARRHLERALAGAAEGVPLAEAHALHSEILFDLGDAAGAYEAARRAAAAAPDDAARQVRLCELAVSVGETAVALEAVDRALALPGATPALHKVRGKILQALGRKDEAAKALRRAVETSPDDVEARLLLGEALEAQGDVAAAERAYREALARPAGAGSHTPRLHLRLGALLERREALDEALECYRKAHAGAGEGTDVLKESLYRLGALHERRGETMDAVSFWESLYRIEPGYADILDRLKIAPGVLSDADVLKAVQSLSAVEFRDLVARILERAGYRPESLTIRDPAAVDGVATRVEDDRTRRRIVHARRWTNDVGQLPLQELHLAVMEQDADGGLFLTTSNLSPAAFKFVQTIKVIDALEAGAFVKRVREAGLTASA